MNGYKGGRFQRALITANKFQRTQIWKTHLRQTGAYNEKYLFQRAIDLVREKVAKWSVRQLIAVWMGLGRSGGRIYRAPLERALRHPIPQVHQNPEESLLQILRSSEENSSPAFRIPCMPVLSILLSNLNSCCSINWNWSASDGYHYKILPIKYSHEYRTQNHFIWLIKSIFAISIEGRRATLSSFTSRQVNTDSYLTCPISVKISCPRSMGLSAPTCSDKGRSPAIWVLGREESEVVVKH